MKKFIAVITTLIATLIGGVFLGAYLTSIGFNRDMNTRMQQILGATNRERAVYIQKFQSIVDWMSPETEFDMQLKNSIIDLLVTMRFLNTFDQLEDLKKAAQENSI